MGIFDGMMGNASEIDVSNVEKELKNWLAPEEQVEKGYKLIRDMIIFTNKRLLLIDKQGVTGKKTEYHSIPYKSITHFSVETAGSFDLDSELKIWISGSSTPLQKTFRKGDNVENVQRALSQYVLF